MKAFRSLLIHSLIVAICLNFSSSYPLPSKQCDSDECEIRHPLIWKEEKIKCKKNEVAYEDGEKFFCVKPIFKDETCKDPNGCFCSSSKENLEFNNYCFQGDKCYGGLKENSPSACGSVFIIKDETCQKENCICTESKTTKDQKSYIQVKKGAICRLNPEGLAISELPEIKAEQQCKFPSGCQCNPLIINKVICNQFQFCIIDGNDQPACKIPEISQNEYCDPLITQSSCICKGNIHANNNVIQKGYFCGYQNKEFPISLSSVIELNEKCIQNECACGFKRIPGPQKEGTYVQSQQSCTKKKDKKLVIYDLKIGNNEVCIGRIAGCACGDTTPEQDGFVICAHKEVCEITGKKPACKKIPSYNLPQTSLVLKADYQKMKCTAEKCVCLSYNEAYGAVCMKDEWCSSLDGDNPVTCRSKVYAQREECKEEKCLCTTASINPPPAQIGLTICQKGNICSSQREYAWCSEFVLESTTLIEEKGKIDCSFKNDKNVMLYTDCISTQVGTYFCGNDGVKPFCSNNIIKSGQTCTSQSYSNFCICKSADGKSLMGFSLNYVCLIDVPEHAKKRPVQMKNNVGSVFFKCENEHCMCDYSYKNDYSKSAVCAKNEYCIRDGDKSYCRKLVSSPESLKEWEEKYSSDSIQIYLDKKSNVVSYIFCPPEYKIKVENEERSCSEPKDRMPNLINEEVMCFNKRAGCYCTANSQSIRCMPGAMCKKKGQNKATCDDPNGSYFAIPPGSWYMCSKEKYLTNETDKTLYCLAGGLGNKVKESKPSGEKEIDEKAFATAINTAFFGTELSPKKWVLGPDPTITDNEKKKKGQQIKQKSDLIIV